MKMTCQRALEALSSLGSGQPAFTADEIEELLAYGLALEADPRDLSQLRVLAPSVESLTGLSIDNPEAMLKLGNRLTELNDHLRSDWYRFTHGKDKITLLEAERRDVRRAVAVLSDPVIRDKLFALTRMLRDNGDPSFAPCPAIGSEIYAISRKGARVGNELMLRLARYAAQPLSVFMKAHDKVDAKMAAFATDIAQLSHNVGPVRKNPHQVVIGLAKTGLPPKQALGVYREALDRSGGAADVAVTVARNAAATASDTRGAAHRLKAAQAALRATGLPMTDVAMSAAKSLLGFDDLGAASLRFAELVRQLEAANLTRGELSIKSAARLMPATGTPGELARRTLLAYNAVALDDREIRTTTAVALASMVRDDAAVPGVVQRFAELRDELLRSRISLSNLVHADALECVACPGTPQEVVETVAALVRKLANGRASRREDVAIAVAFAKRFAY